MITTPQDYLDLLYRIQDANRQTTIVSLPKDEKIYEINLNERTIEAPEFLSVEQDHNAETVYFKMDRYFDNVDLARNDIHILVQYENADTRSTKKGYFYAPPFVDVTTFGKEDKIIFPWVIEGAATAYSGTIKFSIKFYKLRAENQSDGSVQYFYEFNLNTLVSTSKVLSGMDITEASENYTYDADTIEGIYAEIDTIRKTNDLYWIDI